MKITGTPTIEEGNSGVGDEKRFVVRQVFERVIIPRELKERRAALVAEIADIDDSLSKLEAAK